MPLITITDSLTLNTDLIESIERKGSMSCAIVMASGEKHLAEFPLEVMMKRIENSGKGLGPSVHDFLKNIDSNTQRAKV